MRKRIYIIMALLTILTMPLWLTGCAASTNGINPKPGDAMATVATVASTAPGLAQQLDNVYAFLVAQKAIPDNTAEATKALAALDAIAPMVQQEAQALAGDKFNWAQFVLQAAITTAQALGYILPLVV